MTALEQLSLYLAYPFVVNALLVGALVALCSSLLGTTLVMKRLSYIGDGLSHVAFGAYAVAAVAMMSVAALAAGYLLMNVFGARSNISGDVCTTLFGSTSILTLTVFDVALCAVLSVAVVGGFALLYNRIFAVTFDEDFARASGLPVDRCNLIVAAMIALVIVVGMSLVGALLLSALVVFPALAAMRVCRTFKGVTILAGIIGVSCAIVGMAVSILASTPVGSTIVLMDAGVFALLCLVGKLRGRVLKDGR